MAFRVLRPGEYMVQLPPPWRLRAPLLLVALHRLRKPEAVAELISTLGTVRGQARSNGTKHTGSNSNSIAGTI